MDWIGTNWIWITLLVGMIALHLVGHRGHRHMSRHSTGAERDASPKFDESLAGQDHAFVPQAGVASTGVAHTVIPAATRANRHRHGC